MQYITSRFGSSAGYVGGLFLSILMMSLSASVADAQVLYGSLVGNAVDQNGAIVPKATVTIKNRGTGQVRETVTNQDGEFSIGNILPGVYDMKVVKDGFSTFSQTDLTITANNVARIDVVLKIGNVSDVVSVTANATTLQTESATVKSEISGREIQSLPISNYRNYQSLLNLVPGTTPAMFQNANTDTPERALTTNVNGTPRNNNNTRLDGAVSVNVWLPHHSAYVAPSESIQEVNISTNNFDTEQGMAGGAAVQVITKSGTNQFHGSGFVYHDNHFFRAKNVFQANELGTNKPKNLRTIPGATFGGPIVKDKLFFFGSWEGMYERVIRDGRFTVPTADIRAGDFRAAGTTIYDPFSGNLNGTGRTPFASNIIPSGSISEVARRVLALVPLPNLRNADGTIPTTSNYYNSAPQTFDRNNYDVKVNWNRAAQHQLWYKFSHMKADVTGQFALGDAGGPCLCDGGSGTGTTNSYIGTVGHTWTIGSSFIVDGNFSVTQREQQVLGPDYGSNIGLDVLGIAGTNGTDVRQSGFPQFYITGYDDYGNLNNWSPLFRSERSYTFAQNASKAYQNHEFRFGADIIRHELNHWQPEIGVGPRGGFTFGGGATALVAANGTFTADQYNSFAAFLLGTPTQAEKSLQYETMTTREWQMGFYFRDRWQVSRNLTLTLGLRYELYPIMHRADRGIEMLDPGVVNQSAPTVNVLLGGLGGNPETLGITSSKKMFAPRIGIAWRLQNDTVLRAGYGITYDPMPFGRPLRGFYPLTIAQTFLSTATGAIEGATPYGFTDAARDRGIARILPFGGPSLSSGVVPLPGTVEMRSPYQGTLHRGYIQSWNLFLERKLPADIKIEAGYVGTQTTHQLADLNINVSQAPGQTQRPLAAKYGRTANTLMWDGFLSANYHSLQVAVNRRMTKGILIKGAYTWSKAINYTDDTGWAGLPLFNAASQIRRNRARAGYDIPHILQFGSAIELPFGKGKRWASGGASAAIVGGWSLSPIFSAVSGRPFTVTASGGTLNSPGNTQTPDLIGDVKILGGTGPGQYWFDPSTFRLVPSGNPRYGTAGRNILRDPRYVNLDLSLNRRFLLTERIKIDFHVDSFNFTNTPHFNRPGTDASASGFATITSALQDQRQFRFGLRFEF